jgi:hypothetical protein
MAASETLGDAVVQRYLHDARQNAWCLRGLLSRTRLDRQLSVAGEPGLTLIIGTVADGPVIDRRWLAYLTL